MKKHRFYLPTIKSEIGFEYTIKDPSLIKQMRCVLRLGAEDIIIVFNTKGAELDARIEGFEKDGVRVKVENVRSDIEEKSKNILYCSLLKRENFEFVVQKETELGIGEIVPLITQRTVKLGFKRERLKKIIVEAVEQSGRVYIPKLHEPKEFKNAMEHSKQNKKNFFLDLRRDKVSSVSEKNVGIFVGPEGGWDISEQNTAAEAVYIETVSLSPFVLRAEPAAIVGIYMIQSC